MTSQRRHFCHFRKQNSENSIIVCHRFIQEAGEFRPEKWKYLSELLVQYVRVKMGFEESNASSIVILSVRLMVSPPGSKAQPWHLDYSGTSANCQSVFVNISKSVKGNCTEYVEFESSEDEVKCIERARAALLKSGKYSKVSIIRPGLVVLGF